MGIKSKNNAFRNLLETSFYSILIKVINAFLLFGIGVSLARVLGPDEYGEYALIISIVMVVAIPVTAGVPNLLVREISKAKAIRDWNYIWNLFKWYLKIISIYTLLLFGFFVLASKVGIVKLDCNFLNSLIYAFCLVPLLSMLPAIGASLRGLDKVLFGQIPNIIIAPAGFLLLIMCIALTTDLTATGAIQLKLISNFIAVVVGGAVLYKIVRGKVSKTDNENHIVQLKSLISLTLIGGFMILLQNIDMLILGVLCRKEDVGVYRVCMQLSNLVAFGLVAINQILHPKFTKLYLQNEIDGLRDIVSSSSRIIIAMALPPVLLLTVFSGEVLNLLFGKPYAAGATVLIILSIGQLLNASFGSVGALLNMTGNENDTLKGMIIAVMMNVLLNFILIPIFGPEGAALSTAVSCLTWNAILRSCVNERLGIESCGWLAR